MSSQEYVCAELKGGLGNQLFIWAAGFALSARLNCDLVFKRDGIARISKPGHERTYNLDFFGIQADEVTRPTGWDRFATMLQGLGQRHPAEKLFEEASASFDERFVKLAEPVTLRGYFQSPLYMRGYEGLIRRKLLTGAQMSDSARDLLDKVPSSRIAVHVRGGDYQNLTDVYTIPGKSYYDRAVKLSKEKTGAEFTLVFTDDYRLARKVVPGADLIVDPGSISHPGDVAMMMSMSSALIGANSSLSWWAAFLSDGMRKPIIFPRPWYVTDAIPTQDLLYPHWQTIEV